MSHSIMVYGQHRSGTIFRIIVNRYDVTVNNVSKLKAKIMICEQCRNEHDGSYGSGRFCSKKCRYQYHIKNEQSPLGTWTCRYCGLVFETKHKLWEHYHSVHESSLGKPHNKGGRAWNRGLTKETDDRVKLGTETYKARIKSGEITPSFLGRHHSEETKRKMSDFHSHATFQRVCKKTQPYTKKDGTVVMLDSSWEIKLAEILDDLNINWIRPKPVEWYDQSGKLHHYFSDFFLEDYNLYLDPKNDYCFVAQAEKIEYVRTHYDNVLFMHKDQVTKEFVLNLINERTTLHVGTELV